MLQNFNHLLTHYLEKSVNVHFYLAGGLAHQKTLNLKGQDFSSGFTPLYDLLSPQLPEHHLPLV